MPVVTRSLRRGRASSTARGKAVRSRISTRMSKSASVAGRAADGIGSAKNTTSVSGPSEPQSASAGRAALVVIEHGNAGH